MPLAGGAPAMIDILSQAKVMMETPNTIYTYIQYGIVPIYAANLFWSS
jgi:hypothetical protein